MTDYTTGNTTEDRLGELREQLQRALEPPVDHAEILSLSTELARLDPNNVRFSVDAGIISRLGRELVARQETAVAELIKNAYDADATVVNLIFQDAETPGGSLEIEDDGLGMTREELIDGFMRLSSTMKVREPMSPRFHRRRAGRKGIGRFAVQRLGNRLAITTQTIDADTALHLEIDWTRFEHGVDLSSVASPISVVPKELPEGTCLIIDGLREGWTEATLRRVYRFVADLVQPYPLSDRTQNSSADPGFKVNIFRREGDKLVDVASEETQIFSHALATIEGLVDEGGHGYWSITSTKLAIDDTVIPIGALAEEPAAPFPQLRNIYFRAYYFIYQAGLLPRSMDRTIRDLAREKGGIRVYRNGFRVRPYGEPSDDWLRLDESTRAREILPPHSNINFFGFVEIVDPEGRYFEETASREGLIENDAFRELREFLTRTLKAAVLRVAETRGRKKTASQPGWQQEATPEERVRDAAKRLRAAVQTSGATAGDSRGAATADRQLSHAVTRETEEITRALEDLEKEREELLDELGMLRVLASLGLVIGEFTHEVHQTLGAAVLDSQHLAAMLCAGSVEQTMAGNLYQNIRQFETYAAYFDRTVRDNVDRELTIQELGLVVVRFLEVIEPAAKRLGITIAEEVTGIDLYTLPMHSSEWASVLFNFYSNSQKAIKRARVNGKILIRAGRDGDRVFVEFADNGVGVRPEDSERIFNAFFTTSTRGGAELDAAEELSGSGLGLKIVHDIATGYGGDVYLTDPPEGYKTCFRFEVPAATDEDILNS